jgi:hypothetical protein
MMTDNNLFETDPRSFAIALVENQLADANYLLLCCLKYMSTDDVRDMLDANGLSPRFDEDEVCIDCGGSNILEETCADCEREDWLSKFDDGNHDTEAMRCDVANNNLEVGDDDKAIEYRHENIVRASVVNGQITQAREQCDRFGFSREWLDMLIDCED